jgi:hypothetical protein
VDLLDKKVLLERKQQLLAKEAVFKQTFGLCYYRPHQYQDRFHRAGASKHRLWESGNRGGKSTGGVAEDCAHLIGFRPWYKDGDPGQRAGIRQASNKGVVVTTDWDKVDEIFTSQRGTEGKLWQMLPRGFVRSTRRNHSGAIELVECTNGSTLRFDTVKSWLTNPQGSESSDYDFIHVDEPCPEGQYKAAARGLIDRDGKDWFTLTPLTEPWIHDMFFPDRRIKAVLVQEGAKWAQRTSTYDNPYLTADAIQDYEDTLTEDEKQCRMLGVPLELSGLVFKEFDWDTHVLSCVPNGWRGYSDPPINYTIMYAIDPHPQTPHHVLFLAVDPTGAMFLYDEIYQHCTIEELSEKINARLVTKVRHPDGDYWETKARFCVRQIADPAAFATFPILNVKSGKHFSMADEFGEHGLFLSKASKAREHAILETKRVLRSKTLNGVAMLSVSPQLQETLFEFGHWCWDERENKPRDDRDHAMENLGRLLLEEPKWIDPAGYKPLQMKELEFNNTSASLDEEDIGFTLD